MQELFPGNLRGWGGGDGGGGMGGGDGGGGWGVLTPPLDPLLCVVFDI